MLKGDMDFATDMEGYQPFVAANRTELLEAFDRNAEAMKEAVAKVDDAHMQSTWTMRNGDQVYMQEPLHSAVRGMAINHLIHHRGQLTVYLRLLDVPVPSTFGPTADDPGGF